MHEWNGSRRFRGVWARVLDFCQHFSEYSKLHPRGGLVAALYPWVPHVSAFVGIVLQGDGQLLLHGPGGTCDGTAVDNGAVGKLSHGVLHLVELRAG